MSEAKTDGVAAIETAKTEGLQAIDKAKGDIETARSGAIKDIDAAKTSGVQAVEAVTAGIEQTKTAAVQEVETAKTDGVAAVNAAVEAGKTNFVTDESLSISGRAADAKIVGDELAKKADQTELEDVKKRQNILVGSETGSRVCVTDAFEAPLEGLVLYGKSTQVTTTGAQLFTSAVIKGENSGVTLTRKDSVWHLEGTNIADGARNIRLIEPTEHFKLPAGTYTLSFSKDGVFPIGINISISKVANPDISSEQIWTGIGNAGLNAPTKFILGGTEEALSIFVNFPAGEYISCDLYVMLNAGDTVLPWKPYTGGKPSPSPD